MPLSKNAGGRHRTPSLKLSSDWTAFFPPPPNVPAAIILRRPTSAASHSIPRSAG
jgi:hypothetical protein